MIKTDKALEIKTHDLGQRVKQLEQAVKDIRNSLRTPAEPFWTDTRLCETIDSIRADVYRLQDRLNSHLERAKDAQTEKPKYACREMPASECKRYENCFACPAYPEDRKPPAEKPKEEYEVTGKFVCLNDAHVKLYPINGICPNVDWKNIKATIVVDGKLEAKESFDVTTFDADKWAKEFVRLNNCADLDMMRGWFANAIMAGYDHAKRSARREEVDYKKAWEKLEIKIDDLDGWKCATLHRAMRNIESEYKFNAQGGRGK